MNAHEKLSEALAHLSDIRVRIEGYALGDRPQSPPASLLRDERRVMSVVAWWRAEVERCAPSAKPSGGA